MAPLVCISTGQLLTDDNGGEPFAVTRAQVVLSLVLTLASAGYAAYCTSEYCEFTGWALSCE